MFLGYSDPYLEVFVNKERKFTTSIKKKTLNPVWDEWVTMQLPKPNEHLEIVRVTFFSNYYLRILKIQSLVHFLYPRNVLDDICITYLGNSTTESTNIV